MPHKPRGEQKQTKARKDPNKLARTTKRHEPKPNYKRQQKGNQKKDILNEYNS